MDHRVSKDMISSGMTPSGKKTQADLGKTQYGSAPSPSRLMDAYQSMYQNQEKETLDEMMGDGGTKPPAGKMYRVKSGADGGSREVKSTSGKPREQSFTASQKEKLEAQRSGTDVQGLRDKKTKESEAAKDRVTKANAPRSGIDPRKGKTPVRQMDARNLSDPKFENVDLLAAYRAVYEHHQKDENGNTIPHDDVKEGKLNPGLQAFLDKKKGKKKDDDGDKKKDKKDMKEGTDLFDTVILEFVNQGYDENDVIQAMSSLNEQELQELQNLDEAIQFAPLLAKLGSIAKGAKTVVSATKTGLTKGLNMVKNVGKPQVGPKLPPTQGPRQANIGDKIKQGVNKAKDFADKNPMVTNMAIQQGMSDKEKSNKASVVSAGADLFDIVKGQLLDEGLSEEEIKDIMLELTPEEILNEISVDKMSNYMSAANKDVQKTADSIRKDGSVMGNDSRVKRLDKRATGMARAGQKIADKLKPKDTFLNMGEK